MASMIHGCRSYNERIGHYVNLQVFYSAGRLLKNVCWPSVIRVQWEKGAVIWTRVYLSSWIGKACFPMAQTPGCFSKETFFIKRSGIKGGGKLVNLDSRVIVTDSRVLGQGWASGGELLYPCRFQGQISPFSFIDCSGQLSVHILLFPYSNLTLYHQ